MTQPQIEVSVILMNDGKVLIGRGEGKQWETPTVTLALYESVQDAAARSVVSNSGVVSDPQHVLFVSESIKQREEIHKVVVYVYSHYTSGGEKFILEGDWTEAEWVDVRELAKYQYAMSEITIDAFIKFSSYLRQLATR